MQFEYHQTNTLPPLAWCARIDKGCDTVAVFHGRLVEALSDGFIEGAWNDSFDLTTLPAATVVCGTGGALENNQVRFIASTDQVSPLFSILKAGSLFVSNSPVFVMSAAQEEPDPAYPFYGYDMVAIWRQGLFCQSGNLPLRSGTPLRVHVGTTLSVDNECLVEFKPHNPGTAPSDYQSYHTLLVTEIKHVFQNAADPDRKYPYQPLAGISNGYDSTATAAMASQAGCKEAMSFTDSRMEDPQADSGAENASYLGMTCTEYDRWEYLKKDGRVEVEFAMFPVAANAPIAALEDQLEGRMVISGAFGDIIWDSNDAQFYDNMSRCWAKFASGLGQIEFRLRTGYLSFAPAYIGSRHNEAIHRILKSEEMRPWSIGGKYDRPMPRRIAEEAGLPRNRFGMVKMASGHAQLARVEYLSSPALNAYQNFVRQQHADVPKKRYYYWRNRALFRHMLWKLFGTGKRKPQLSTPRQRRYPFLLNAHPTVIPWDFMFTFQWVFNSLKGRYQTDVRTDAIEAGSVQRLNEL